MKPFKRPLFVFGAGISVVIILLIAAHFFQPFEDRGSWEITIASGTKGGTYYPLGQQFARILEKLPEIQKATSLETAASIENMQLLCDSKADIALIFSPAITVVAQADRQKLSVLARLYTDVIQIVVQNDKDIHRFEDLNGKKVYVGRNKSGTKVIAEVMLNAMEISPAERITEGGYQKAAQGLIDGSIDAAFFASGKPTNAVQAALESGNCSLLDLQDCLSTFTSKVKELAVEEIPINFYANQRNPVKTLGADALLMCRNDLTDGQVDVILNALFDNTGDLLMAHTRAHDIRFEYAFNGLPETIDLHPAAKKFKEKEQRELLIATGAYGGKYYELGKKIQTLLCQCGIHARAIHTDGSLENMALLTQRPTLAIVQYDAALASYWGTPELSYGKDFTTENLIIPEVRNIRRIATLHKEIVHIMIRRDRLSNIQERPATIQALQNVRVCLGPSKSGSRVLAESILAHHGIVPKSSSFLSVPDMVERIHAGEISAGFFVSAVPSGALKMLLNSEQTVLLSVQPQKITKLIGSVLKESRIEPGTYGCQKEGEPAVETLETRAILVAKEDLPFDVQAITAAIFKGAAFLGMETKD
ncbi:hypothetical protein AMJ86_02180, partial [bacterium SM23_57]